MKKNKKGFISITVIYSFFILFITVLLLIMYNYINDRKMNNKIKSDLLSTLRDKSPDIALSDYGSTSPHPSYNINILILDGGNGIASAKYTWSANPLDEAVTDLPTYNETVSAPTDPGFYYLIVKACDVNDHCKTVITNFFQVGDTYICKKAETLHNENCTNTDENGHCVGYGLEQNSIISYGTFTSNYMDDVGTAYDCDVNGDDIFDPVTERFYYLNDFYDTNTKEFDDTKAVLVYYTNVHNGVANSTHTCAYTSGNTQTPTTAYSELPTTSQWSNVTLISAARDIMSTNGFDQYSRVYSYTGSSQTFTANYTGTYKVELWGAQGGSASETIVGGKGAYTAGLIELTTNDILYVYVGSENSGRTGGYNGGGNGSSDTQFLGGGGSTDVRLVSGTWNDPESLASRIMIAGGGGGSYYYNQTYTANGGSGGTFLGVAGGIKGGRPAAEGGWQTAGGKGNNNNDTYAGSFGQGGTGANSLGVGGGGGYYGGGGTYNTGGSAEGGGGGSSYISGQVGCIAVTAADDLSPRVDSNNDVCTYPSTNIECSYHYSGKKFTETEMVDGNGYESVFGLDPDTDTFKISLGSQTGMPTHDGDDIMNGNEGNGFAKITYLGVYNQTTESYDLPADLPTNMFTYTNKAARLISYQELKRCVDLTTYQLDTTAQIGLKNSCTFLFENTKFASSANAEGYFLESYYPDDNTIWVYDASKNAVYSGVSKSTSNKYGVRPVIEIPKTRIQYN